MSLTPANVWKTVQRKKKAVCKSNTRSSKELAGKTFIQRRSIGQIIIGKGKTHSLKAVTQKAPATNGKPNRYISGTFISRLDPSASSVQIAIFIHHETGLTVRPEKLSSKHHSYSSFFIRGNQRQRSTLMNENLWPIGAVVKPFYE